MKKYFKYLRIAFLLSFFFQSCKDPSYIPVVESLEVNYIVHNSAIFSGNVLDNSGSMVFRKGVCLSQKESPSMSDSVFESSFDGNGEYIAAIYELQPFTKYYVRAFAENNYGIAYGKALSFFSKKIEYYTDERDGNSYAITNIGTQTWFAENLKYTSDDLSEVVDADTSENSNYGFLYSFETAKNNCPLGWHLPSDEEWKTLERFIGLDVNDLDKELFRGFNGGDVLKIPGNKYWLNGNDLANNQFAFSVYPSGNVNRDGIIQNIGNGAFFWTSTLENDESWIRYFRGENSGIGRMKIDTTFYCSVRCIKDE